MLVLTRKLNEEIVIGQRGIKIRIIDVRGGRVRLGVVAPDDVRIERGELHNVPEAVDEHAETICH